MYKKTWLESQGIQLNNDKMEPRLTICYTYYEEPVELKRQIALWENYPPGVLIFVVDDGSSKYPAFDILKDVYFPYGVDIQLWRCTRDLGFNGHGCRNLAATYAPTEPIMFLDIDITLNPCDVGHLRRLQHAYGRVGKFSMYREYEKGWEPYPGHLNCFITTKETFWDAGGYDESFVGLHTGDRDFHEALAKVSSPVNLGCSLTLHRGGRGVTVDPYRVTKGMPITYDNDNMMIYYPVPPVPKHELQGTVTNKVNFPHLRLL